MSTIQATIRETKTKGQVNDLRSKGNVPGIVYGGEQPNEKISITTKELKNLILFSNKVTPLISIRGFGIFLVCLLYTSPSPRDLSTSRMPSSA